MLPSDTTIHDRYRIIYPVDERPGSTVYRGRDEQTGRLVLIAAIAFDTADFDDVQLLVRQVAALRNEVILPVLDHLAEGALYYVICDDVGGQDLERTVRARGGSLAEAETLTQARQILEALDSLHGQKPALYLGEPLPGDVWIGEDGAWRITPFTLIRPIGRATSPYRAPELDLPDAEPAAASDLYALCALLYHALTGWAPPAAAQRQAGTPLSDPRTLNPNLSTLAAQVLLRGLQLRPENRYQVAREMRLSLEMVQMMDGRSLGMGPDLLRTAAAVPSAPPPPAPPPAVAEGYPAPPFAPAPPPYPTGIYPAPPFAPGAGQPYPPGAYAPPPQKRRISTGCLVAVAVALTLAAVAICAALAWFIPGSPLPALLGARRAAPGAMPIEATSVASAAPAGAPPAGAVDLGPRAITLQNAGAITQTREITGATLGPVAFAPDGKTLAVGIGGAISLRDADTLEEFAPPRRLEGHAQTIFTLAWSPDSALLASGAIYEKDIRLWSPSDGQRVRVLSGHGDWIRAVAFSPDGKTLASGSWDRTVRLWDVASGSTIRTLTGHTGFISTVAFAPDGKTIASSSSDGSVRMWDVATGQPRAGFAFDPPRDSATGAPLWATGLAFTKDGAMLAVGMQDGTIKILDAATGAVRRTLTGHRGIVVSRGVQLSPDGRTLATASWDGTVRLWDIVTGTQIAELDGHRLRVLTLAFSADGARLASTSDQGGQLLVWDVKQARLDQRSFKVGQGLISWMLFSPDGSVLGTVGYNGTAQLRQLDTDRFRVLFGSAAANKSLAFLNDGRVVSISDGGAVAVIGPNDPQARPLSGLDGDALNVVTTPDGKLIVAGSTTGAIGRWDGATGAAQPLLRSAQLKTIYALAVADDGGLIAAGGPPADPRIEIWDAVRGQVRHTLSGGSAGIAGIAFQPHGDLLVTSDVTGQLRIWNARDGTLVKAIAATPQQQFFPAIAFSPDGRVLATGSLGGDIAFWDPQTGDRAADLLLGESGVFSLAFSPDGQRLAAGLDDQTVRILELQSK